MSNPALALSRRNGCEEGRPGMRIFQTPWGWMGLVASEKGISRIILPRPSRHAVERELVKHAAGPHGSERILNEAEAQLQAYLAGARRQLQCSVDLSAGSPFQRRVWRAARAIPYGRVRSYQWVAMRVGGRQYARAVGLALGANPVPLLVPCHRVLAHDGSLGGFTGGLRLKRRLLALEGALPSRNWPLIAGRFSLAR